jgi:hypothetical protein
MNIKFSLRLAGAFTDFITKDKNVKIPKEKMSDFEKLAKSLETTLNEDLQKAFEEEFKKATEEAVKKAADEAIKKTIDSFRGKLVKANVPGGFDISYDYADKILKDSNIKAL